MKRVTSFFRHESVLTYFALVFLISWGGGFLILGPAGLPLRAEEFASLGALLYLAILGWLLVGALVMAGRRQLARPPLARRAA